MLDLISHQTLLARRGIGRLIESLMNGEPVAWWITGGVVVFFIGSALFSYMRNSGDTDVASDAGDDGSDDA